MIEVKSVTPLRHITFEELAEIPEFKEVKPAMYRNRVKFRIECSTRTTEFWDLTKHMEEFCNKTCEGFWTYTTSLGSTYDYESNAPFDTMTNTIVVFFEKDSDLLMFNKDYAVLAKLGQV